MLQKFPKKNIILENLIINDTLPLVCIENFNFNKNYVSKITNIESFKKLFVLNKGALN